MRRDLKRPLAVLMAGAFVLAACGAETPTDDPTADDPTADDPTADDPDQSGAGQTDAGQSDATPDPSDWDAIVGAAQGATVNLHMWGGSTEINAFVDDFYAPRLADEHDITLNRVPLADTADAVSTVLSELDAGRTDDGAIDLIWINGENFATLDDADALLRGWAPSLPNAELVDWDDPSIAFDAGRPVDGAESPWGSAQFQFVYDEARTDPADLPRSYAELADYIVANPGRVTYPSPPAFHGTRFIKQWFYELSGGPDPWLDGFDEDAYDAASAELWDVLDDLREHLWQGGETYPNDIADLDRLFANGEVDLTFTQLPAGIDAQIDAGVFPSTARPYVFDTGTIGDSHYLAIPANASSPEAAMVVANLALEPDLQVAKLDPANGWGDGIVVEPDRLDDDERAALQEIEASLGETAVDQQDLAEATLPEVIGEYTNALDRDWDHYVRQQQPRG
ncbi:MAG: ABC transporter substrate-binding protein [Nitriliruptor sp.]|nr:MAG: ABC transporter substrate-binding protein [Nitriliruptor sp.]